MSGSADLERMELVARHPVRDFASALLVPLAGMMTSLGIAATMLLLFGLHRIVGLGQWMPGLAVVSTGSCVAVALTGALGLTAGLPYLLPDLKLELTRHHLAWAGRRFLLESIRGVGDAGLTVDLGSEKLALPASYRVDERELERFRAALAERFTSLEHAEDREAQRQQLASLTTSRRTG